MSLTDIKKSNHCLEKRVQRLEICNGTGIVLPRYYDHVYIFVFVNIEIKTLELFTCRGWLHTLGLSVGILNFTGNHHG